MKLDFSRLYSQLQNTGLQNKDNSLYQVIRSLIDAAVASQSGSSSIATKVNSVTNIVQFDDGNGDSEMAANKVFRFGPIALTNTLTTNILNPGTTTGGVNGGGSGNLYIILKHVRWVNKTAGAITFSHWLGATGANAAGTEVFGTALSVAANAAYDWYGLLRLDVADFLVGGASAGTSLSIEGEGEIGVD